MVTLSCRDFSKKIFGHGAVTLGTAIYIYLYLMLFGYHTITRAYNVIM